MAAIIAKFRKAPRKEKSFFEISTIAVKPPKMINVVTAAAGIAPTLPTPSILTVLNLAKGQQGTNINASAAT